MSNIPNPITNINISPTIGSEFENGDDIIINWNDAFNPLPYKICNYLITFTDAQSYLTRFYFITNNNAIPSNYSFLIEWNGGGIGGGQFQMQSNQQAGTGQDNNQSSIPGNGNPDSIVYTPTNKLGKNLKISLFSQGSIVPGTTKYVGEDDILLDLFNGVTSGTINWTTPVSATINFYLSQSVPYSTDIGPYNGTGSPPSSLNPPSINITKAYCNIGQNPSCICNSIPQKREIKILSQEYGTIKFNTLYNVYIRQIWDGGPYKPGGSISCSCSNNVISVVPFVNSGSNVSWFPRKNNFANLNCQGQYRFRCNWVRPGRLMNKQPIVGVPLQYKYMNTMGSALTNNRIQSNMLQNAIFAKRTKVVTISRTNNCGEYNNCGNRPLCKLNTGNINPNFINR